MWAMLFRNNTSVKIKSLRSYLFRLVLVAVLPLLIFASGLIFYLIQQQNLELERRLKNRAKAATAIVDDHINSFKSSLQVLVFTEEYDPAQFEGLHRRLIRAVKNLKYWDSLILSDLKGNILVHTTYPLGTKLIGLGTEHFFQQLVKTKSAVISPDSCRAGCIH